MDSSINCNSTFQRNTSMELFGYRSCLGCSLQPERIWLTPKLWRLVSHRGLTLPGFQSAQEVLAPLEKPALKHIRTKKRGPFV